MLSAARYGTLLVIPASIGRPIVERLGGGSNRASSPTGLIIRVRELRHCADGMMHSGHSQLHTEARHVEGSVCRAARNVWRLPVTQLARISGPLVLGGCVQSKATRMTPQKLTHPTADPN